MYFPHFFLEICGSLQKSEKFAHENFVLAYHTADKEHADILKTAFPSIFMRFLCPTKIEVIKIKRTPWEGDSLICWSGLSTWIFENLASVDFLFKKPGDCRLSRAILKSQKNGIQAILRLFESVSSSIEGFWSASNLPMRTHAAFNNNFVSILCRHAPKKTKNLWRNQKAHFIKNLRKQIMIISCLNNKANKSKYPSDSVKFKWQQNLLTNLNK